MASHATYLTLLLVWALPVLALQWAFGGPILRPRARLIAIATALPTVYLVAADGVAIRAGIWMLHGPRILGLRLLDVPVEEALFFLFTNLLVVQTVTLVMVGVAPRRRRRRG